MKYHALILWSISFITFLFMWGCKEDPKEEDGTCDMENPNCNDGLVCAEVQNAEPMCLAPVKIVGHVLNISDDAPIEGALIQARDANGAAAGTSAVSDAEGAYELIVPAVRDAEGKPLSTNSDYTLAAQAQGFELFPTAVRPSLPIDVSTSVANGDSEYAVENAITTIKLFPIQDAADSLGIISGTIESDNCAGILVVAEADASGVVGFSDSECEYTIFNVPAGTYTVMGYAVGVQLTAAEATVATGNETVDVDLTVSNNALSTVSGNVNIVNAPGDAETSVILAVESTFVEGTALAQIPPGLRVGPITGQFVFENVPDGRYVVLAAYENDFLVRDPDQSIGGTSIVHIQVPDPDSGNNIVLPESFKVTEALEVVSPGAEEPTQVDDTNLILEWVDDSSEQSYEISVIDALGNLIWETTIDGVSGSETASVMYAGDPLEEGMYYQFKVTSISNGGSPLSTTEDLKGVFYK
ncbi:MAG: carboxypeptidase regulatory-like domain-containing protein [Deltaproteobacteria bacterium]|nr:carboxypeptidase regulatory-like domain-containing protein [Deltaproteobacteria bacterium]MBN2673470.1 carboxypeptidase regulatory-like domain-containing protein [Deltaproteobacteria bacterium]